MGMPRRGMLAVLLALASVSGVAHGRVREGRLDVESGERPLKPLLHAHGLEGGAQAVLEVWDVHVSSGDPSQLGFFLARERNKEELHRSLVRDGGCILRKETPLTLLTLSSNASSLTAARNISQPLSGEYTPWFTSCDSSASASLSYRLQLFNSHNSRRDYLSSGEAPLPTVYLASFLAFAAASGVWMWVIVSRWTSVHKIHLLMLTLVLFKAMTSICRSAMYNLIRWYGDPEGWNVAYYVFTFLRGILLFTVIVLIGTGWSFIKPYLESREKHVIAIVVPLQVLANVAIVFLDENGPNTNSWFTWRDIFHLLDIICCCAVLFPIVWSIQHLRSAATTDGKAARNINKLRLFRHFYIIVVCYVYFTRIVVYLVRSTVPYNYAWIAALANELATLGFYIITAFKFMPSENNPYLRVDVDDLDAEEVELEEGDGPRQAVNKDGASTSSASVR